MPLTASQKKRIEQSRKKLSGKKEEFLLKPVEPTKRQSVKVLNAFEGALNKTRASVLELYESVSDLQDFDDAIEDLFSKMTWWEETNFSVQAGIGEIDLYHREAFYESMNTAIGINVGGFINEQGLGDLLDMMANDASNKVTDLKVGQQKRIADLVRKSIVGQESKSPSLEKQIRKTFKASKNEAKFIARDQTQRVVNSLNQFRQERSGIEKYKWITSKDNRVRSTHAKMNGIEVEWKTGKIVRTPLSIKRKLAGKNVKNVANGHVGQDYQCRCSAIPVLEI